MVKLISGKGTQGKIPVTLFFHFFFTALTLFFLASPQTNASGLSPYRESEAVVIPGFFFGDWVNGSETTIPRINVYRYEGGGQFTAIPFQIDKKRKINLRYNMNDPTFPIIGKSDVCEFGYFREIAPPSDPSNPFFFNPFISDHLAPTDELVFMLADAGDIIADPMQWPAGDVSNIRYQIALRDLRNGGWKVVYVHLWNSLPTDLCPIDYVTYLQDQNVPPTDPCQPVSSSCGTAEGFPSGRLQNVVGLKVHFKKNWVTDGLVVKDGSGTNGDLLNRIQLSSPGENEDVWSNQGAPRFLAIKDGPVRVIRGIQGAASGGHTTKYEFVYPTSFITRVNLRVHFLSFVRSRFNHEYATTASLGKSAYVHGEGSYNQGQPLDQVDGEFGGPEQLGEARFKDWAELLSRDDGSYVTLLAEQRIIPTDSHNFTYKEKSAEGVYGAHGREWGPTGNMQDGFLFNENGEPMLDPETGLQIGNDGGCPVDRDPESGEYSFSRFELSVFPHGSENFPQDFENAQGPGFKENQRLPIWTTPQRHVRDLPILPRPTPCVPGVEPVNTGNGDVYLSIDPQCAGYPFGYLLFRGKGVTGPLGLLHDLGTTTSMVDFSTQAGKSYRYAVAAYNDDGTLGSLSQPVSILVIDTTPPAPPNGVTVEIGSKTAVIRWNPNQERDLLGYNIYLATAPGGPYQKINAIVHPATSERSWVITALNPITYYVRLTAVDFSGNEGSPSAEVPFVPDP